MRGWIAMAGLMALVACGGGKGSDEPATSGDSDADTDADTDTDTDADTDTDTDADADADTDSDTDTDTDSGLPTATADTGGSTGGGLSFASCERTDSIDEQEDGSVETTIVTTFDADALVTRVETTTTGGVHDLLLQTWVDERLTVQDYDAGADGSIDTRITRTYDASGLFTGSCTDFGADGTCEGADRVTYVKGTDLRATYALDYDGDGIDDGVCVYVHDAYGRRTSYSCDGILDRVVTYSYPGPGPDDVQRVDDFGSDGIPDAVYLEQFDADGRLIHSETDVYTPRGFETVLDHTWRSDGQIESVVGQNVVPNGNSYAGPYGYGEYATYDADGYLTSYRLGFDVIGNDGIPEIVVLTTTTWDCP